MRYGVVSWALENMALILALEVEGNFATGLGGSWPGWDTRGPITSRAVTYVARFYLI